MEKLSGQHILVGVTGGISAYKSPDLVRRLKEKDAIVRVAMTASATQFLTPLTMHAISGEPVHQDLLSIESETAMDHIELARWADQIIIAPASANFIARLSAGLADDLLSTICLATEARIAIAPAMNRMMWNNPATQRNIANLKERGISILGPEVGSQACGEIGPGRMREPEALLGWFGNQSTSKLLNDTNILVTAGPTWEALDPVRGLTNHSSGKMGYAIANAALKAGAKVTLITGPTALLPPHGAATYPVTTAEEMLAMVENTVSNANIFISVAAVSDYRPKDIQIQKIKKRKTSIQVELIPNPDILATVAARPSPPFTVGFAAETNNLLTHAREKLKQKNVDLIVANQIHGKSAPFGQDYNALTLLDDQHEIDLGYGSKEMLAARLISEISSRYYEKHSNSNSRFPSN